MRKTDTLACHLRVALWAAAIAAAGALLAGLCGLGLARALPAGGAAEPLPVYTSLSLAAEDEPLLPIWQRYDPEQTDLPGADEPGTDLARLYACILWPMGAYSAQLEAANDLLPFERLAGDDILAYYLPDYPLPGSLLLTDLASGRMVEKTGVQMDLAFGYTGAGVQLALRLAFPGEGEADPARLEQTAQLVQSELCAFLAGQQNALLGILPEGWYSFSENTASPLLERLELRDTAGLALDANPEIRLQQLCDALMLDAQIIRLENEVLLTLTDRYGGGMLCVYCDARLQCVSGVAVQLA